MILISHRGNINGRVPERENTIDYIQEAIEKGYNVEVDVRFKEGELYLGHDNPQEKVDFSFLSKLPLWVHAKNIEAVEAIRAWNHYVPKAQQIHYFWHETDHITLTSKNFPWVYPGKKVISNSIAVMPELFPEWDINKVIGVCSDFIHRYDDKTSNF